MSHGYGDVLDDAQLRLVLERKEDELRQITELRVQALQSALRDRDLTISEQAAQLSRLRADFEYNLELFERRDAELQQYEALLGALREQAVTRDAELSDLRMAKADADEQLRAAQHELDACARRARAEVGELHESAERASRDLSQALHERERDFARRIEQLETEAERKARALTAQADDLARQVSTLQRDLEDAQADARDKHQALRDTQWQLEDEKRARATITSDLEQQIERLQQQHMADLRDNDSRMADLHQTIKSLQTLRDEEQREREKLESRLADLQGELDRARRDAHDTERTLEAALSDKDVEAARVAREHTTEIDQLRTEVTDIKEQVWMRDQEVKALREKCELAKRTVQDREVEIDGYKSELEGLHEREKQLKVQQEQQRQRWEAMLEEVDQKAAERSNKLVRSLQEQRGALQTTLSERDAQVAQLEAQLSEAQGEAHDARSALSTERRRNESLAASLQDELKERDERIAQSERALTEARAELAALHAAQRERASGELRERDARIEALERTLSEARSELNELRTSQRRANDDVLRRSGEARSVAAIRDQRRRFGASFDSDLPEPPSPLPPLSHLMSPDVTVSLDGRGPREPMDSNAFVEGVQRGIEAENNQLSGANARIRQNLQRTATLVSEQRDLLELQQRVRAVTEERDRLQAQLETAQKQLRQMTEHNETLSTQSASLRSERAGERRELDEARRAAEDAQREATRMRDELNQLRRRCDEAERRAARAEQDLRSPDLQDARSQMAAAQEQAAQYRSQYESMQRDLDRMLQKKREHDTRMQMAEGFVEKIDAEKKLLRSKLSEATEDVRRLMDERDRLIELSNSLRSELDAVGAASTGNDRAEVERRYLEKIRKIEATVKDVVEQNRVLKAELDNVKQHTSHGPPSSGLRVDGQRESGVRRPQNTRYQSHELAASLRPSPAATATGLGSRGSRR